jgi:hypothetical protein
MALLIGVLAVLFVVAFLLSEGPWGRRWRERRHDAGYTGSVVGGGDCDSGFGDFGGGGGGGGDGGGGGC